MTKPAANAPGANARPRRAERQVVQAYDLRQMRGQILDDNSGIWLALEDTGSNAISLRLSPDQATHLVAFLVGLTQTAAAGRPPANLPTQVRPIAIEAIGLAAGRVPGEGLLTVALGPISLSFSVTPRQMQAMAKHLHSEAAPPPGPAHH